MDDSDRPENPHEIVLLARDPEGNDVGMNAEAWWHIREERGRGIDLEAIRGTIEDPDTIFFDDRHGSRVYATYLRDRRFYRNVCVKRWDGRTPEYQVSTAYGRSLPPMGKAIWRKNQGP